MKSYFIQRNQSLTPYAANYWEMREYTREAPLSPSAQIPAVKTSHTFLAFFRVNVALDTDGARRQCRTFSLTSSPLPMTGPFFRRADPVVPDREGHVLPRTQAGVP